MNGTHPLTLTTVHPIGTIVSSTSHVDYWCQIALPHETAHPPSAEDYAFGTFVGAPLPHLGGGNDAWLVGIIYDTLLVNPSFGSLGPRLSTSDEQRAVFSPDYLSERATLVRIAALGTLIAGGTVSHDVPALALSLGAGVVPLTVEQITAFHDYADTPAGDPYLHMGYLPRLIGSPSGLLPQVALNITGRIRQLFPRHQRLLTMMQQNLAWKFAVETAG